MKIIKMSEATEPLAEYAQELNKEPLVLTVDDKPVAALVSIENADLETITLSANPQFLSLIAQSRKHQKSGKGISSDEMRRRLDTKSA